MALAFLGLCSTFLEYLGMVDYAPCSAVFEEVEGR